MTVKRNITVKNIYHMLAYAFKDVLKEKKYGNLRDEEFDHQSDLLAAILVIGADSQIKRGLDKNYIPIIETKSVPTGRIDISASIKNQTTMRSMLVCEFDDFTANIEINKILKTALNILIKDKEVSPKNRKQLKKSLFFLGNIDLLDPADIKWSKIQYHKNNVTYRMLLYVCYLVISHSLMSENGKKKNLSDYFDDQKLGDLFENFVRNYYDVHYHSYVSSPRHIRWNTDNDDFAVFLPVMKTDIMLESKSSTLIIDTKFYTNQIMQGQYEKKISSNNLYQMYAYIKNKVDEKEKDGRDPNVVSGMILYAKTETGDDLDIEYSFSGNTIFVKTLNMNDDWKNIRSRLDSFIDFLN